MFKDNVFRCKNKCTHVPIAGFDLTLRQLQQQTAVLATKGFRPGTRNNQNAQINRYLEFCRYYGLEHLQPSVATICAYITFLARQFTSATSVRNYISGVRLLHKQHGIQVQALDSFQASVMLRATKLTLRAPAHRVLPITPRMLYKLCMLCDHIAHVGVALKVALTFGFYAMVRQSNLAPRAAKHFDSSRHTCRADVIIQPPGLCLLLKWSKSRQAAVCADVIPIPTVPGSPTDPLAAYQALLQLQPTRCPTQPLLSVPGKHGKDTMITTRTLAIALKQLLSALHFDSALYSLHSLRRGGASAAYNAGVAYNDIKRHGQWKSDAFWLYITSPCVAKSPVAAALARVTSPQASKCHFSSA
jgi:hypothetical protein